MVSPACAAAKHTTHATATRGSKCCYNAVVSTSSACRDNHAHCGCNARLITNSHKHTASAGRQPCALWLQCMSDHQQSHTHSVCLSATIGCNASWITNSHKHTASDCLGLLLAARGWVIFPKLDSGRLRGVVGVCEAASLQAAPHLAADALPVVGRQVVKCDAAKHLRAEAQTAVSASLCVQQGGRGGVGGWDVTRAQPPTSLATSSFFCST